jgi:hypothetical protein
MSAPDAAERLPSASGRWICRAARDAEVPKIVGQASRLSMTREHPSLAPPFNHGTPQSIEAVAGHSRIRVGVGLGVVIVFSGCASIFARATM